MPVVIGGNERKKIKHKIDENCYPKKNQQMNEVLKIKENKCQL